MIVQGGTGKQGPQGERGLPGPRGERGPPGKSMSSILPMNCSLFFKVLRVKVELFSLGGGGLDVPPLEELS